MYFNYRGPSLTLGSWLDITVWWKLTEKDVKTFNWARHIDTEKTFKTHFSAIQALPYVPNTNEKVLVLTAGKYKKEYSLNITMTTETISIQGKMATKECELRKWQVPGCDRYGLYSTRQKLTWSQTVLRSKLGDKYYISVPGILCNITISSKGRDATPFEFAANKFGVNWTNKVHRNYHFTETSFTKSCEMADQESIYCLKATGVHSHYLFVKKVILGKHPSNSDLVSWKNASQKCAQYRAHLPQFHSREEMEEVLALFKWSGGNHYFHSMEALFIGLKLSTKNRWTGKSPLVFQMWANSKHSQKDIDKYIVTTKRNIITDESATSQNVETPDISDVLSKAQSSIYPDVTWNFSCTMMLISNLALPEWINVNCHKSILKDIFCSQFRENIPPEVTTFFNQIYRSRWCHVTAVLNDEMCVHFEGLSGNRDTTTSHPLIFLDNLKRIFDAISVPFQPVMLLTKSKPSELQTTWYNKKTQNYEFHDAENVEFKLMIEMSKPANDVSQLLLRCENVSILRRYVCDGKTDCPDASDEFGCVCFGSDPIKTHCKLFHNKLSNTTIFSNLYFHYDLLNRSYFPHKFRFHIQNTTSKIFVCRNGYQIDGSMVNDLVVDCNGDEDEQNLKQLLKYGERLACLLPEQVPCKVGSSRCFSISEICSYRLDKSKNLQPCRTGGHIENCKDFQCNRMFKCIDSYCVPWTYVCDGTWGCPNGFEEKRCREHHKCRELVMCHESHLCIHISNVCDGHIDCPQEEDESMCGLSRFQCPAGCHCLVYASDCKHVTFDVSNTEIMFCQLQALTMSNCSFVDNGILKFNFQSIIYLSLQKSKIHSVCGIITPQVELFDVSFNLQSCLTRWCLHAMHKLRAAKFDNNKICKIESQTFKHLFSLKYLNISSNLLSHIPQDMFSGCHQLSMFSLQDNDLDEIEHETFVLMIIVFLETDNYRICCVVPEITECSATKMWFQTCSNLVPNLSMKVVILSVSLLTLLLNFFSLYLQRARSTPFQYIVTAINISDLFCGSYLLIISVSDIVFGESFFIKQKLWGKNPLCYAAFWCVLTFNVASPVLLSLMALSRLRVTLSPFSSKFKEAKFVGKLVFFIFFFVVLSMFVVVLSMVFGNRRIPSSFCLPYIDPENESNLIAILTTYVTVSQTSAIAFITICYIKLQHSLKQSAEKLTGAASQNKEDQSKKISVQLTLVTSSNLLCWLPSCAIYLSSLLMTKYPTEMLIWTTVTVMPINSIVNPAVFVATALRNMHFEAPSLSPRQRLIFFLCNSTK